MLLSRALRTTSLTHLSIMLAGLCAWGDVASANPEDGVVAAGSATITSDGKKLEIHQSSDHVVIDWRTFNIDIDEHTQFYQPSSASVALNRVNSADPSYILGKLSANGNIILINPNGIMFGRDSRIDVNGIVATTANIKNENFMAGSLVFDQAGHPDASIINEGQITAKEAGLVGIVAPNVINTGIIEARLGRIHLASGDTATVDLYGDGLMEVAVGDDVKSQIVVNEGLLDAAGGTIAMTASAGKNIVNNLVVVKGELKAPSVGVKNGKISIFAEGNNAVKNNVAADKSKKTGSSAVIVQASLDVSGLSEGERGGDITVTGDNIAILNGTVMNASGYNGKKDTVNGKLVSDKRDGSAGGNIRIGGDYLGQGDTATAQNLFVDTYTLFYNDALQSGDAGRTIFWSDNDTIFKGNVYARGGTEGGNGGFLETSGHHNLVAQGFADLTAQNGYKGTYFLDPTNILISGNFAPTDIAGLELWLDGNDIDGDGIAEGALESGLFSGVGGCGSAITCVGTWVDKALGNNATQATAARRPVFNTNTQNGMTYVTFNGDTSSHYISGSIGATSNNTSVFTATFFAETNPTDFDYVVNVGNGNTNANFSIARSWTVSGAAAAKGLYSFDGAAARSGPILEGGEWNLIGGRTNPAGDRYTFSVDGVESAAPGHGGINSTNGSYALGYYAPGNTHYFDGYVGEVLIYDAALSADQNMLINQYQSAKWGVGLVDSDPVTEASMAMDATSGYSVFTTRYLERLSQSADISLQASTDITFDLKGDTLALAADRNLTLTAGHDIKTTNNSSGMIQTSRVTSGGNVVMTAGNDIDLRNITLKTGGGDIDLNATGNVSLSTAINTGGGTLDVDGYDISIYGGGVAGMPSLVGYYRFDEGMGTILTDYSGNNNHGTVNGATWSGTNNAVTSGNVGSLSFDGSNDYVRIADSNSLDLTNGFTISVWIKSNGAQTSNYLLSKLNNGQNDNVYSMVYGYAPDQVQFYGSGNTYGFPGTNSNINVADTGWHQVAYTYNGKNFSSYQDGVLIGSAVMTSNLAASTGALLIGAFNTSAGHTFSGLIDDVRIYNKALGAGEVSRLATPVTWQTGTTNFNAANNINFDLKGDALSIVSGNNFNVTAANNITQSSIGSVSSAGNGNINMTSLNDIAVTQDFDLNATGTGNVSLLAHNSILYSGSGDITTQGGTITLNSDRNGNNLGAIALGSGTALNSNGGNITLTGGATGTDYAYGTVANAAGISLDGTTISSGAGNIVMRGNGYTGGSVANSHGVWLQNAGTSVQSTSGTISVYGRGGVGSVAGQDGWGNLGAYIVNGANIVSNSGNIIYEGIAGTGNQAWNTGAVVYTNSSIRTAGSGTINVTGTNNTATAGSQIGVWLGSGNGYIQSENGAITVSGISTRATADSYGLYLYTSANGVRTTGSGAINISGSADALSDDIYYGSDFAFGSGTATGNIAINANKMSVVTAPTITTTGTVTFAPRTANTSIGVAGGPGTLEIPTTILDNIIASTVILGRSDGSLILSMGPRDWSARNYDVRLLNGAGRIAFNSGSTIMGNRTLFAQTDEYVRLQNGSSISSTAAGDAITLIGGTGFTNMSASAMPITVTGGGRMLIYSGSIDNTTLNGMTSAFRRFSCTYGGACPTLDAGNGFLYANTPLVTVMPDAAVINYNDAIPVLSRTLLGYLDSDAGLDNITGTETYTTAYVQGNAAGTYNITGNIGTLASSMGYGFTPGIRVDGLTVNAPPIVIPPAAPRSVPSIVVPQTVLYISQVASQVFTSSSGAISENSPESSSMDERKKTLDKEIQIASEKTDSKYNFSSLLDGLLKIDPELAKRLSF